MSPDQIIAEAFRILEERAAYRADAFIVTAPSILKQYLRLWYASMADQTREHFAALWLDAQGRLICREVLFSGTLTQASVYPRELVKAALKHSAASVILAHNHPSGTTEPSGADRLLTDTLARTLALVDVKILDHFIVTDGEAYSFAEHGMI